LARRWFSCGVIKLAEHEGCIHLVGAKQVYRTCRNAMHLKAMRSLRIMDEMGTVS